MSSYHRRSSTSSIATACDCSEKQLKNSNTNPVEAQYVLAGLAGLLWAYIEFESLLTTALTAAIDLWQYSHYTNAVACMLIFAVTLFDTPQFLRGSQAERYSQLTGFGFLAIAIQSYHCATSLNEAPVLTESNISSTISVVVYNLAFGILSWPLRIKGSPPLNGAEKFLAGLAIATSVGMVPALFL